MQKEGREALPQKLQDQMFIQHHIKLTQTEKTIYVRLLTLRNVLRIIVA